MSVTLMDTELAWDGTINRYFYDDETDALIVNSTFQNTNLLIEQNKQARNYGNNGFNKSRSMRKIAELDPVTIHKLLVEHHIDVYNQEDMPRLKKWLRDRDNRAFVTVDGRF